MFFLDDKAEQNLTTTTNLNQLFDGLPAGDLGNRFLVISRRGLVEPVLRAAVDHQLFHVDSQWVYVVTDTRRGAADVTPFLQMGEDGYNLAFVYNTSREAGAGACPGGLVCLLEQGVELLAGAMEKVLLEELETFDEVSIEEWEIIMPTLQV